MSLNSKTIVSGTFKTEEALSKAVEFLKNKGIPKEDMSILISENTGESPNKKFEINTSNKVPEVAVKGLASGVIIGGIIGSLSFVGVLIVPVMEIAIAGPIIGALAGIAAGSIMGSLIGAVFGVTIPEYEAVFFSRKTGKNNLLITKVDKSIKSEIRRKFLSIGATNIVAQYK